MDLSIPVGERFTLAFPTPIYHRQWADDGTNARLRQLVLEKQSVDTGIQVAQVGGWHSRADLLEWPDPVIGILRERMVSAIGEMVHLLTDGRPAPGDPSAPTAAWANVSRGGHFHSLHDHAGSVFSGVYYVSVGRLDESFPAEENAAFVVPDPRLGAGMVPAPGRPFGRMLRFPPKPGLMLLFPSWLPHMANPFHGVGERISISFNVCRGGNAS
jgi:uncharacterized protein (TIGR02466 family)